MLKLLDGWEWDIGMSKVIEFYIDMMSPFSYLAQLKLPGIAKRYGYTIKYHAIDIPAAKKAAGNYGPSNREVPAKLKVMSADMQRWAKRYGVPLIFPKNFNCLRWNIGILFAESHGEADRYVHEAYARIWGQGIDPTDDDQLRSVASVVGFNVSEFLNYIYSSDGEEEFRRSCEAAHANGIFGAPIMTVGDQTWWGNDRLDFVEEYLKDHAAI